MKRIIGFLLTATIYIGIHAQTKEFRIEKDGFEWYLVSLDGKYGVSDYNGNTLLPTKYDAINYYEGSKTSGYCVELGDNQGFYNIDGKQIIPTERNYKYIHKGFEEGIGTYYRIQKTDGKVAFCNQKGQEVYVLDGIKGSYNWWTLTPHYDLGFFYFVGINDDTWNSTIINGEGEVVFDNINNFVDIDYKKQKFIYEDDDEKTRIVGSVSKVKTTFNPFTGNENENFEKLCLSIGYMPFKGKVDKHVDDLDGQTKFFLERDGLKGIRDLQGRWVVPLCNDYKLLSFGSRKYYIVTNVKSQCGLYSLNGDKVLDLDYDTIEDTGGNYVKVKRNGYYGIASLDGKEIISTSRGYTSIDYNSSKRSFAVAKTGYTGVCDAQGNEISLTKLPPTPNEIKTNGGYTSVVEHKDGSTKYWKVSKNGRYGLTDAEGKVVVPTEMEALESAGTGYLRYKLNSFWGVMNYAGKIIIDTDRGYTSIGDFKTFNKRFPYTMNDYKGECDATGRQISKIKVETPQQQVVVKKEETPQKLKEKKIIIEHKHDPVPMQVWKQCTICYGSGKCQTCGGTGVFTGWSGNKTICEYGCGGSGRCSFCAGKGGVYEVEYR